MSTALSSIGFLLLGLTKLQALNLVVTNKVTDELNEVIAELKKALPKCEIRINLRPSSPPPPISTNAG